MMLLTIAGILLFMYAILMGTLLAGWLRLHPFKEESAEKPSIHISIIIAVRNEEKNLPGLLRDIGQQNYSSEFLEVIVVDDLSTDQGPQLILSMIPGYPFRLRLLSMEGTGLSGKKMAIQHAVKKANGELIITTDADCCPGPDWVLSIARFYGKEHPSLILGPVSFHPGNSFFTRMQELEFLSLMFSTAGAASAGFPMLANGANLAYERTRFLESGGYEKNSRFVSGDDVFLLHRFKERYGGQSVRYLFSRQAIVFTKAEATLQGFWSQRLRWVSKSRGYRDAATITVSSLVFIVNFTMLILMVLACFSNYYLMAALCFWGIKLFIDFPAFMLATSFAQRRALLGWVPLLEVLNALYTTFIGIAGNLLPYTWKGRSSNFTGER